MPQPSNPQRGRDSVIDLLDWLSGRLEAVRRSVLEADRDDLMFYRMDAVWRGQVWFDLGEEDTHALALVRAALEGSHPSDAVESYLVAKARDAQIDFSELLDDVSSPDEMD